MSAWDVPIALVLLAVAAVTTVALAVIVVAAVIDDHRERMVIRSARDRSVDPATLCQVTGCDQEWTVDRHGWRTGPDCTAELDAAREATAIKQLRKDISQWTSPNR